MPGYGRVDHSGLHPWVVVCSARYWCNSCPYCVQLAQAVFCWLCCGEIAKATEAATIATLAENPAVSWLKALVAVSEGKGDLYAEEIRKCISSEPSPDVVVVNEHTWLRLWFEIPLTQTVYPGFYFTRLPSSLTGLDFDIDHAEAGGLAPVEATWWNDIRLPRPRATMPSSDGSKQSNSGMQSATIEVSPTFIMGGPMSGDSFTFNDSQVGAAGQGAQSTNSIFTQGNTGGIPSDFSGLTKELDLLREAMKKSGESAEADVAIGEIAGASVAARDGDEEALKSHLARAGKWALGIATSIGASLAVAALKAALGL